MTFEEIRLLIPQYLSDRLTPSEELLFEEQLSRNAELRRETDELRELWDRLEELDNEQPGMAMRVRFYQKLNALERSRDLPVPRKSAWGEWKWWPQLAAALGIFLLGLLVGHVPTERRDEVAQLRTQVQNLHETVALSLLDRQSAASRLEGVSWGSRVQHPDRELLSALITTLNRDPNTNVRLASLDALEKFSDDETVRKSLVDSLYVQNSPLVQIALIDSLVHIRDNNAAGSLRKLSSDTAVNAAVRQRAQWGLEKLTYQ